MSREQPRIDALVEASLNHKSQHAGDYALITQLEQLERKFTDFKFDYIHMEMFKVVTHGKPITRSMVEVLTEDTTDDSEINPLHAEMQAAIVLAHYFLRALHNVR